MPRFIPRLSHLSLTLAISLGLCGGAAAQGQEVAIRKNLAERLPKLPKIDEVNKTPVAGVFEVRYNGTEILYTDAEGKYIFEGSLIDTRSMVNLTEQRIEKLTAIDFSTLPLKDAVVIKQGTGQRRMAVFVDPNCGYCKRFERDLLTVKDVTVYTFLMPILGPDSTTKSRDIWCAKDAAKSWRSWMLDGVTPSKAVEKCDVAAVDRNLEFGRKHRLNGTPALLFEDGSRKPGALPAAAVEQMLAAAAKKG